MQVTPYTWLMIAGILLSLWFWSRNGPRGLMIPKGSKVVIHDDVLATGGTVEGIKKLVEQLGAEVVGTCFIIELTFLEGRKRLEGTEVHALITY